MSTFDVIARRIILEADIEKHGIMPEYVLDNWLVSRYKRVLDKLPYGAITARGDAIVNTTPSYNTGTVSVSQNSQIVTGVGTTFDVSMIGMYIRFGVTRGWYQIIDSADATHLLLDNPFVDATRSGSAFYIAQRFYEMPDGIRWIIDAKNVTRAMPLTKTHRQKMDEMFPDRVATPGVPLWWCPVGWNQINRRRQIEIYPFANTYFRLEFSGYSSVDEPQLDSAPLVDIDDRVLMEGGLADAFNFKASRGESIEMVRAWLDVSRRHENIYNDLLDDIAKRDSSDAPQPRVRMLIQKRDVIGIVDPLINAEQEIYNRPPSFG